MSRESECNYGGQDDNEYMMSHLDYDASCFEDMGDDYYTDNDPHDMMDHHQDFCYNDSDYSSVKDMERYHDIEEPSSDSIDSKYIRIYDVERSHDYDYMSSNENEVRFSAYASTYGTDFDYNDMVERHTDFDHMDMVDPYIDGDCSSFTDMENYYDYYSKYSDENFGAIKVKSDYTKRHGTTQYG